MNTTDPYLRSVCKQIREGLRTFGGGLFYGNRVRFVEIDHPEQAIIAAAILAGDDEELREALRAEIARMPGKSATI